NGGDYFEARHQSQAVCDAQIIIPGIARLCVHNHELCIGRSRNIRPTPAPLIKKRPLSTDLCLKSQSVVRWNEGVIGLDGNPWGPLRRKDGEPRAISAIHCPKVAADVVSIFSSNDRSHPEIRLRVPIGCYSGDRVDLGQEVSLLCSHMSKHASSQN